MSNVDQAVQEKISQACEHLEHTVKDFGIDLKSDPSMVPVLEEVVLSLKDIGDESALNGACFMVGAYLGEMLRQRIGGVWVASHNDGPLSLVMGTKEIFPIEKVRKFAIDPKANGLDFYMKVLLAKERNL